MKLLIAGAGFIVQDWLQITKDLSKVELTGIAGTENDLTTMKELDKQYNIPKTISISASARLFLSDILDENISKILYVDCDALFMDSLEKLWSIDISQNSVAGVLDHVGIQNKLKIGLKINLIR